MSAFANRFAGNAAKIIIVALLSIPAVLALWQPAQGVGENRYLAAFPAKPHDWETVVRFPARLDLWINDHFGFRDVLVQLNNRLRYTLFKQFPTLQVIEGQGGRIFLATHSTAHAPYAAITQACGYRYEHADGIAKQVSAFDAGFRKLGVDARLLVAPSSPVMYESELPVWLRQRCDPAMAPVPRVMMSPFLAPEARQRIYYPIAEAKQIGQTTPVIPKTWFHWSGTGPRLIAAASVRHFWDTNASSATDLKTSEQLKPSDISHLFPGVELESKVEVADFKVSGIEQCAGPACHHPALQSVMAKLGDISLYRNASAPDRRLVMLSDSFGQHIAGWYSPFYREVVHLSTNNLAMLDDVEIKAIHAHFLQPAESQHLLFLYHDGSLLSGRLEVDLKKLGV
ncbi:hypothetical protein [Noviherbaspirillum saxi]|uniref:AlgX/AlgJ SGNH hydrolase-like domain-containing protein n=1 Tax=Noviherbaspirillum saxi TaxID=2320863 RepID=A0A3A3FRV3_9BURK|nr:hypothetical protein [Noviherbaspirillum saxi]RJF98240.1 hypothetical protein D3871_06740 [Noviherbaspirillum saxi]